MQGTSFRVLGFHWISNSVRTWYPSLLYVEVTVPATLLEGEDIDSVIAQAKEDGIKDVKKNDDSSVN